MEFPDVFVVTTQKLQRGVKIFKDIWELLYTSKALSKIHKGELTNCVINYYKPKVFIEIENAKGSSEILNRFTDIDKSDHEVNKCRESEKIRVEKS